LAIQKFCKTYQFTPKITKNLQQNQKQSSYSDTKALEIDREVEDLIKEGYTRAVGLLREHSEALESLTQALLEFETIDGEEVELLVKGSTLSDIRQRREELDKKLSTENKEREKEVVESKTPEPPSKISLSSDSSESPA